MNYAVKCPSCNGITIFEKQKCCAKCHHCGQDITDELKLIINPPKPEMTLRDQFAMAALTSM